jgi:hypothetical protein
MNRHDTVRHEFVRFIPDKLDPGIVYVSTEFATASHSCLCGCGVEVITPLTPTDWELHFDGETISLHPSIGNSTFACQSHYWIKRNRIHWTRPWTMEQTRRGRAIDAVSKERYFEERDAESVAVKSGNEKGVTGQSLWQRIMRWL